MHFFKIFPTAMVAALTLPAMLMAKPAPAGNVFDARDLSDIELRSLHELFDRQAINTTGLIGLLTSLTQSLAGIEQLLSPSGISNINEVVTDLAVLLKAPTTDQTKSLLGKVSNLLGSSEISQLISGLPAILSSVSGLLTPALVTNVTDIISGAHDLLTPTFVSKTKGLIADVAPLVNAISQVISALLSAILYAGVVIYLSKYTKAEESWARGRMVGRVMK